MPALHLINRPDVLARCADVVAPGDRVLCIENGVLACLGERWRRCAVALAAVDVYVLRHDVDAAGAAALITAPVRVVDDAGFVDLVATSLPVVSWT
jgi:sulfur relay protein TusB/DsrH